VFAKRGPDDELYDNSEELRKKIAIGNSFLSINGGNDVRGQSPMGMGNNISCWLSGSNPLVYLLLMTVKLFGFTFLKTINVSDEDYS
jgi:hypothetical protein